MSRNNYPSSVRFHSSHARPGISGLLVSILSRTPAPLFDHLFLVIASLGKQLQERDEFRKGGAGVLSVIVGNKSPEIPSLA